MILRGFLVALGVVLLALGFIMADSWPWAARLHLFIWGTVLVVGVGFERWRYRSRVPNPGEHWEATGERFEDPETGQIVDVLFNPATGERSYKSPAKGATVHVGQ